MHQNANCRYGQVIVVFLYIYIFAMNIYCSYHEKETIRLGIKKIIIAVMTQSSNF